MNEQGEVTHELRIDNNTTGTTTLLTLAKSIDSRIKAVVEPSANSWIRIYEKLE
jgi:hypothetical protein